MNTGLDCTGTSAEEAAIKDDNVHNLPPTTQACAACKFQRRKCSADCPLAPYFPANRLQDFQNVRRLFGVKNVLKTLGDLDSSKRFNAAECMIFEANCRAKDLVGGCYRIIATLQREITLLEAQRRLVAAQLRIYRQTAVAAAGSHGGAVLSEFCGVNFDRKPGISESTVLEDWIRKEVCSSSNERLIKKTKNEVDFNLQVSH